MMMKLTSALLAEEGEPIWISPKHIISVRPAEYGAALLSTCGVEYRVKEDAGKIVSSPNWIDGI